MNCKDTQTALDSVSRRNPIGQSASGHLADCSDCRRYSDQSSALLALVSSQPRVEAPADFDFRLRARIARAESQPSGGPVAVLANFFGLSFQVKQAAVSLAALAIMVAGATFYFTSGNQSAINNNSMIAGIQNPVPQIPKKSVEAPADNMVAAISASPKAAMTTTSSPHINVAKLRVAMFSAASPVEANIANNLVRKEDTVRVFNRERGQVMEASSRPVYGVEGSAAMAKPAVYAGF